MAQLSNSPDTSGRLPAFVHIDNISCAFGDVEALRSVNLRVRRGEIFGLLGPPGCGKTALLRIIAGLLAPTSGEVRIEGRSLAGMLPEQRPVNTLFQSYALFPHMTAAENIAFGLQQQKLDKEKTAERVDEILQLLKIGEIAGKKPDAISAEQQQRVALARALAREPKLLLLDDPLSDLDRKLRGDMQLEMVEIIRRSRTTSIIVTHDQEEAMVMSDRLALMRSGQIIQKGTPAEIYQHPNCAFSAAFLGVANLFTGQIAGVEDNLMLVNVPDIGAPLKVHSPEVIEPGASVTVAVRPEKLVFKAEAGEDLDNTSRGVIEDVAYTGAHTSYHVQLQGGRVVVVMADSQTLQSPRRLSLGSDVVVGWSAADGILLTS